MPILDGRELPANFQRWLEEALQRVPDEEMLLYAADFLKVQFTKASAVRAHVVAQWGGGAEITPPLRSLLQLYARGRLFVEAMDPAWIGSYYLELAAVMGREAVALALLLDNRSSILTLGDVILTGPSVPLVRPLDRERAEQRLQSMLERWAQDIGVRVGTPVVEMPVSSETEPATGAPASDGARTAKLEKILEDQKRRHRDEVRQLREELERERKERAEERARADGETRVLRESLVRAETTLESERGSRDAMVRTAIEEEKRSLLRAWLARAEEVEAVARTAAAHTDLVARAEALVEAQAKADRHTGNRRELTLRLEALEKARVRLSEAARESLQPLPAVVAHGEKLAQEIARLEAVLGRPANRSAMAAELVARIEGAASVEQAWSIRPVLDAMEEQRMLASAELSLLERTLVRRLGVFAESRPVDAPLSADQSWSLRTALQKKVAIRLLIDGHNVALGLPDYFGEATAGAEAERKAREKLVSAVSLLGERYPHVEIELHWDGARGGVQSPRPNVRLEFSGGVGAQRADAVILGRLHHVALAEAGRVCFLVSDDRRLREDAQREGARFVRTRPFAILLEDTGCLGRQPILEMRSAEAVRPRHAGG